jgi:hypothetical protein
MLARALGTGSSCAQGACDFSHYAAPAVAFVAALAPFASAAALLTTLLWSTDDTTPS